LTKPHWEKLHSGRLDDIRFWLNEIYQFKLLLRKHPDDEYGDSFRVMIAELKMVLRREVLNYEKIYGDKPNMRLLREEVEQ